MDFLSGRSSREPPEYHDFILMRDVYRCTPEELDRQDNALVEMHLGFLQREARERDLARKRAELARDRRRGMG